MAVAHSPGRPAGHHWAGGYRWPDCAGRASRRPVRLRTGGDGHRKRHRRRNGRPIARNARAGGHDCPNRRPDGSAANYARRRNHDRSGPHGCPDAGSHGRADQRPRHNPHQRGKCAGGGGGGPAGSRADHQFRPFARRQHAGGGRHLRRAPLRCAHLCPGAVPADGLLHQCRRLVAGRLHTGFRLAGQSHLALAGGGRRDAPAVGGKYRRGAVAQLVAGRGATGFRLG